MSFGKKSSPKTEETTGLPGGTWTGNPATSTTGPTKVQQAAKIETAATPSLLTPEEEDARRRQQTGLLG